MRKLFTILTALLFSLATSAQLQRLPLRAEDMYPNMMVPLNDINNLFDDDPATNFTIWSPPVKPVRFNVDLESYSSYIIKQIKVYWPNGNPSTYKLIGVKRSDNSEIVIYNYPGGAWMPWEQTVDTIKAVDIKMLIIESQGGGDYPDYLKLYGSYTELPRKTYDIKHYPLRNMMQANSHNYDFDSAWWMPADIYAKRLKSLQESGLTGFRSYWHASNNTDPDGNYSFNPTYQGGFLPEPTLKLLYKNDPKFQMQICWEGQTTAIKADWTAHGDDRSQLNLLFGADRSNPFNWAELGRNGYAIASRFGSNTNGPDYPLHVSTIWYINPQILVKGSRLSTWVEPWNENNAFWDPAHCLNTSEIYASMSAFYDGHKGLIPNAGAKKADPNILVSSGGMASADPWILHEGKYWAIKNRGYRADGKLDVPYDYFSYHDYPSDGSQYNGKPGAVPFEKSTVKRAKRMVEASHQYANGEPVGIGETGMDINPGSDIGIRPHDGYTPEQARANQGVRLVFKASQVGLMFVQWYTLVQEDDFADTEPWTIQFRSMGMTRAATGSYILQRRTITDYFYQLRPYLDYVFAEAIVDNDSIQVLKFVKPGAGAVDLYVGWTIENVTRDTIGFSQFHEIKYDYNMNITGTRYDFTEDSSGVLKASPFKPGKITLSSRPILFTGSPIANAPLPIKFISFTAQKQGSAVLLQWKVDGAKKFEVERSSDGSHFTPIAKLTTYSLIDLYPLQGFNFYRLKMFEDDGSFSYSPIARVQFSLVQLTAKVLDITGRKIKELIVNDTNRFEEQLKHDRALPAGVYIIQYSDNKKLLFNNKIQKLP